MSHIRFGALAALTLTVLLAACSTDNDLAAAPYLEPQFGTADEDVGIDVAITSTGNVAVLSQEKGYVNNDYDYYGSDTESVSLLWQLYDKNGSLVWANTIASDDCGYEDYYGYACFLPTPKTIVADKAGNSYSLIVRPYSYDIAEVYTDYYLYKYNSSGSYVRSFNIGSTYGMNYDPGYPDVNVDGGGNIYAIVRQDVSGTIRDVVKKYYANGSLHWQRISPVGTPYGITVNSTGNVYVVGSQGMARLSNTGTLAWTKTGTSYAVGQYSKIVASGTNFYTRNVNTIRKYDANGKLLWSKVQSGLNTLVVGDISADANGNVYIAGKYRPTSSSPASVFTRKLSASGAVVWTKTFGTTQYDDGRGIATINGSEIYVTGETQGSLAHSNYGGSDAYLRKINNLGNQVWIR